MTAYKDLHKEGRKTVSPCKSIYSKTIELNYLVCTIKINYIN